jgi:hypothetical protein
MTVAAVRSDGGEFTVNDVKELFPIRLGGLRYPYAVAPDGKRLLVNIVQIQESKPDPVTVVVNWTDGLRK